MPPSQTTESATTQMLSTTESIEYEDYYDLEPWQINVLTNIKEPAGQQCMLDFWNAPKPKTPFCNATWDTWYCWPMTSPNTTVYNPCPLPPIYYEADTPLGHRFCTSDGQWSHGNWTNYTACIPDYGPSTTETTLPTIDPDDVLTAFVLRDIYFIGSIISLVLLAITWAIFQFFKSLHCSRISVHKNLVVSFILRYLIVLVIFEPYVSKRVNYSYRQVQWLCKLIVSLLQYSILANIFWMFVEGLFLHNRLAISVFSTETPFTLYYIIGWGVPALFVLPWGLCMHFFHQGTICWDNYSESVYTWIIIAPIIIALTINLIFLIKIISILVRKLTANNTVEHNQFRKAVKATVVLFPLLGITNLLFFSKPAESISKTAYHIVNALLQVSQGIFVSVIYCFLNGEVQGAIKKKWQRYQLQRFGSIRGRRRTSRTSSFFLSQTENSQAQQNKLLSNGHCEKSENGLLKIPLTKIGCLNDKEKEIIKEKEKSDRIESVD